MDLKNHHVIVTGAASGLGAATAHAFSAAGARVTLFDRDERQGAAVARDIDGAFVSVDVTSEPDVERAVAAAQQQSGSIHALVQCAGIGWARKILGKRGPHSLEEFEQVLRINLLGTFNVARWTAHAMRDNPAEPSGERGVIINTTSIAAYEGQIGQVAYAASKGGVASMTLPLARELAQYGIRVAAIAPGIFATPMLGILPETTSDAKAAQIPFPRRLGHPEEYAALARHIVENAMINGAVIRLDGAVRLGPQ